MLDVCVRIALGPNLPVSQIFHRTLHASVDIVYIYSTAVEWGWRVMSSRSMFYVRKTQLLQSKIKGFYAYSRKCSTSLAALLRSLKLIK